MRIRYHGDMWFLKRTLPSDKDGSPLLSSGLRRLSTAFVIGLSGFALSAATLTPETRGWYRAKLGVSGAVSTQMPSRLDPLAEAVLQWDSLRQSSQLPFQSYASFLKQHPGWPLESNLRRSAEQNLRPDSVSPTLVVDHFQRYAPMSNTGALHYAEALFALGRTKDAGIQARTAWVGGALPLDAENRLLSRFASQISGQDHDSRMDRLLWDNALAAAQRQIAFTTPQMRPYYEARLALKMRSADAAQKLAYVESRYRDDPALVSDKARWQRDSNNGVLARRTLADFTAKPGTVRFPLPWMRQHLDYARAAANDRQWELAYAIAANTNPYSADTVLRSRSHPERDLLTSLEWLAGWTAYYELRRPADAIRHFERYSLSAETPQTQSKGDYWAGLAAKAAGKQDLARSFFEKAATHPDHFYGQLAFEMLKRPISTPTEPQVAISSADRTRFNQNEVVRAARLLSELGDGQRLPIFTRALAASASSESDLLMTAELARSINRPDLGVQLARNARRATESWMWSAGYPVIPVPSTFNRHWTMIHAITRQESEFNREAVSRANARGLMQLMPGTARETAGKVGLPYDYNRLTTDINYNVTLGGTYFSNLLDRYNGSYILAAAAYNAGPGNVNKWINANGDPRLANADVVRWIELIPFLETRGYVQRVLENAVIYDILNPARSNMRQTNRISAYLQRPSAEAAGGCLNGTC